MCLTEYIIVFPRALDYFILFIITYYIRWCARSTLLNSRADIRFMGGAVRDSKTQPYIMASRLIAALHQYLMMWNGFRQISQRERTAGSDLFNVHILKLITEQMCIYVLIICYSAVNIMNIKRNNAQFGCIYTNMPKRIFRTIHIEIRFILGK